MTAQPHEGRLYPLASITIEGTVEPLWSEDDNRVRVAVQPHAIRAEGLFPGLEGSVVKAALLAAAQEYVAAAQDPEAIAAGERAGEALREAGRAMSVAVKQLAEEEDPTSGLTVAQLTDRTRLRRCEDRHASSGGAGYHLEIAGPGADDVRKTSVVLTDDGDSLADLRHFVALGAAAAQVLALRGEA